MIYDFQCTTCEVKKEAVRSMDDFTEEPCTCGGKMVRLITVGTLAHTTHDWALTDYDKLTQKDRITFRRDHCGGDWFKKG